MSLRGHTSEVVPPYVFPPPPGVTPDYTDPDRNFCGIVPLMCVFIPLSTTFLALRLYTKARILRLLGWEDVAIVVAWLCAIGHQACYIWAIHRNIYSIHTWNMTLPDFTPNAEALAAAVTLYLPAIALPKVSILLFYLRLNPSRRFRYCTIGVICITFGYMISVILAQLLPCRPVRKYWAPLTPGTCIDTNPLYLANSIINTTIDLVVLVLPIPMIVKLQVNRRTKLVLAGIFSLCSGTVVVSALRIWSNTVYQSGDDILWETPPTNSITVVEINLMIICGSIMVLRPFCRRHLPFLLGSGKSRPSDKSPGINYDGPMGPKSKSAYRAKVSGGGPPGATGKRSLWSGFGTNRTAHDDDDMEYLSAELRALAPHAMQPRDKGTLRNMSRCPRAREAKGNETPKTERWHDYQHTQDLGHVETSELGAAGDSYPQQNCQRDLEHGIVKTVSLDIR